MTLLSRSLEIMEQILLLLPGQTRLTSRRETCSVNRVRTILRHSLFRLMVARPLLYRLECTPTVSGRRLLTSRVVL